MAAWGILNVRLINNQSCAQPPTQMQRCDWLRHLRGVLETMDLHISIPMCSSIHAQMFARSAPTSHRELLDLFSVHNNLQGRECGKEFGRRET